MTLFWRVFLVATATYAQQQCVTVQVIKPGDGVTFPQPGDSVTIDYTGTLTNGQKFDSSRDRGKPFSTQIGVGNVIQGWDTGVPQLSLGERAYLHISAACGYGAQGAPPSIPGNADLIFDVELKGINGRTAPPTPAGGARAPQTTFTAQGSLNAQAGQASLGLNAQVRAAPPAPSPTINALGNSNLPECTASSCGNAISWDPSGLSAPVCLCNPLCVTMASTPGILPCCPKLQQVCLDPYRSPSPHPPAPPASAPAPKPVAAASSLPACRAHSCGKAMSSGPTSTVPVCACDVSCYSPTSTLPCCPSFQDVCQNPAPTPVAQLSRAPITQTVAAVAQLNRAPQAQTSQLNRAPPAQTVAATTQLQAGLANPPSAPAAGKASKGKVGKAAPAPTLPGVDCALGGTKWDEQTDCDKKRWGLKQGKCKKVCPATNPALGVVYWDKTDDGKNACEAAADACHYPKKAD